MKSVGRKTESETTIVLYLSLRASRNSTVRLTVVEIRFNIEESGTRVTVEHRGWAAFASDHPVRHGLVGEAFKSMIGLFWADLLVSHRARSEERT